MAFISLSTIRRVITALSSQKSGNEVLGSLGQYGGFSLNSDASIKVQSGDIAVIPNPGGAPGTYRVLFPNVNSNIQSLDWFHVAGFTPRSPTGVETAAALVCGYNQDASTNQWYITVQIVGIDSQAVLSSPPQNFVVGVRAAMSFVPQANPQ